MEIYLTTRVVCVDVICSVIVIGVQGENFDTKAFEDFEGTNGENL